MARSVCKGDPRTIDSRRADAVGALACGESALSCQCDAPCLSGAAEHREAYVVIRIIQSGLTIQALPVKERRTIH